MFTIKRSLIIICIIVSILLISLLISYIFLSNVNTSIVNDTSILKETITINFDNLPENAKKLEMILIQPGTFTMGSPIDERGRNDVRDWPPHEVTISKPFYMGKYEVTQAQWEAIMGPNSHNSWFKGLNTPVNKVSWLNCQRFIKKLNKLGQGSFRLPTEAEWEYACRAGTTTRFSFGDALECKDEGQEYCEIADENMWWTGNVDNNRIMEVGLKKPNPWGLYDMHGNVSEWCQDIWEKPYEKDPQTDPQGPYQSIFKKYWLLTNHVGRGGSTYYNRYLRGLQRCRSASRSYEQMIDCHYTLGFRIVKELELPSRKSSR